MEPQGDTHATDSARDYDVVVLGGGPAGKTAARAAIEGSTRTAVVIEDERVGGECTFWACIPSKSLLRAGAAHAAARTVGGADQRTGPGPVEPVSALARRDRQVAGYDDGSQADGLTEAGVALLRGRGRLDGARTVVVDTADGPVTVRARRAVVLATGSVENQPPIPGLSAAHAWGSRDATGVREIPRTLAVIGGGAVAVESASFLRALGTEVTMIVRGDRLLPGTEPFAGRAVADALTCAEPGRPAATVRYGAEATRIERADAAAGPVGRIGGGPVEVEISDRPGGAHRFDELLVATGRGPALAGVGVESVGMDPEAPVDTDPVGTVTGVAGDWLYAVGDVAGRPPLTHVGQQEGRACGAAIAARAEGRSPQAPPAGTAVTAQVLFTDPQVATVGLTAAQARDEGRPVRVVDADLGAVAGAGLHRDGYRGQARLVVDTSDDTVRGATFVGPDVAEMVHAATIAVAAQVPRAVLRTAIPAFPTMAEVWHELLAE